MFAVFQFSSTNNIFYFDVELSVNLTDFDGDSDILVLPLDTTKFESHEEAFTIILNHFGQVKIYVF